MRRLRVACAGFLTAALLVAAGPALPVRAADSERASWSDAERRAHGAKFMEEREVEDIVPSIEDLDDDSPITPMESAELTATQMPEGVELVVEGEDLVNALGLIEAGPVTIDLGKNIENLVEKADEPNKESHGGSADAEPANVDTQSPSTDPTVPSSGATSPQMEALDGEQDEAEHHTGESKDSAKKGAVGTSDPREAPTDSSTPSDHGVTTTTPNSDATSPSKATASPSADAGEPVEVPEVRVEVADQKEALDAGVAGVLVTVDTELELIEPAEIVIDYSEYAEAFGGDWASRLQLTSLAECQDGAECGEVLESVNDFDAQTVTARVEQQALGTMALAAAASGSTGDWSATPLAASSSWEVSARTGSFSWSYPMRVPTAGSRPSPSLALSYSSGSVDGRVSSSNNQTSWIGEGWSLESGFIERRYVPCANDQANGANNATRKTGDLCWHSDNATIQLGGQSGDLILDKTTGTWRVEKDSAFRVERLTGSWNAGQNGEYWRVTDTAGVQYYFGRDRRRESDSLALNSAWTVPVFGNHPGEPCYKSSYASSSCEQVWRWNLDYVVDPSGNSMTYVYAKETNKYGRNNNAAVSTYTAGGYLTRIDYATRTGVEIPNSPARIEFTVSERCLASGTVDCSPAQLKASTAKNWPDVPFDLICTSSTSCPSVLSPVFFTRKRLTQITTKVLNGSTYRNVDRWDLTHTFPDPGDATSPALWLSQIQHTGLGASTSKSMPAVTFQGVQMANRVEHNGAGSPPMNRYRISSIRTEAGATTSVNYSDKDCTPSSLPGAPHTNTRRCFPVYWSPEGSSSPVMEYFHKYVVTSAADNPGGATSESVVTSYNYQGGAAWHYDDSPLTQEKQRTWSDFRGYQNVDVVKGAPGSTQSKTSYVFFRGMNGDRSGPSGGKRTVNVGGVTDEDFYAGMTREEKLYDGSKVVSGTKNTPWHSSPTATNVAGDSARYTGIATVEHRVNGSKLPGGGRTTRKNTTFDSYGMPTKVEDLGDISTADDDLCTQTTYARNTSANILATVSRVETVAVNCDVTPEKPVHVVSDIRTHFDGLGFGKAPTKGLPTLTERVILQRLHACLSASFDDDV